VPLVKQAVAAAPPPPAKQAPVPEPKTSEIDTALLQFMLESSAPPAGAPAASAPAEPPPPSFDFDLDVTPSSKPAAPPLPPPRAAALRRDEPAPLAPAPFDFPPFPPAPAPAPLAAALPAPEEDASPFNPLAAAPPPRAAPLLIDVTPISLGVEVAGGFCDFLIRANTPVPCDRTRVFRTASDNQVAVRVRVVQGESERFSENTYLGDLELSGLRAAARGEVEVAVTFEIDADGILNVRAKEEASGRETIARMNLLGAQTDSDEVAAMMARQRKHEVA
jgi:molecular chaperone DnaK